MRNLLQKQGRFVNNYQRHEEIKTMMELLNRIDNKTILIIGICLVAIVAILAIAVPEEVWIMLMEMGLLR